MARNPNFVSLSVSPGTRERILDLARKGESYDEFITRLLDVVYGGAGEVSLSSGDKPKANPLVDRDIQVMENDNRPNKILVPGEIIEEG